MMFRSSSAILVAQLSGVILSESFHTIHAIQIHNAPNPVFKAGKLPLIHMKFKNNIPLQQHETTNELAQSGEYHF